ncbi:high choriolytic enzyme 1-like protein [Lates japonicus]|uniref:High choriolytic enzyme 1-like protein n=1 Tax=Lates japonicus TaxID=270547 RepID=A0AAD3R4J8_LATJO|nr:high choriolytic enzyme 1-like protein [Lates japonicus]
MTFCYLLLLLLLGLSQAHPFQGEGVKKTHRRLSALLVILFGIMLLMRSLLKETQVAPQNQNAMMCWSQEPPMKAPNGYAADPSP